MNKNYILALFLGLFLIVFTYFVATENYMQVAKIKDVVSNKNYDINEINEEQEKYILKAYIPNTKIDKLNEKIQNTYSNIIDQFKKKIDKLNVKEDGRKFELNINFTTYEYDKYLSFLITYTSDFGGAHPDKDIVTINYNADNNTFVDIDLLTQKDKDILNKISTYSYEVLKKNEQLMENEDQLKQGTAPLSKNFENFVFSKDGIVIFFKNYSIASYCLGDFEVVIPYSKINI